ncbi:transfer protein [Streptomyces goshikiensis]|uniref:transfer protein n=1 Tax=Streptomyces goshikiensis TaxID=1942 RepID=UPI003823837F
MARTATVAPEAAANFDVVEIEVAVPPGRVITYDHRLLCSALGVTDPACVAVETDGLGKALVTIYKRPPLAGLPEPDPVRDLVMDADGYITVGRYHDGEPARMRLYEPGSGAQRAAIFGTTGAGKSRALQLVLAAEKRSGICTWLADLKMGQSVPEARGQVDWHVTTPEDTIRMLRAAVAVALDRMKRYAAMGRSSFFAGMPDPLLTIRIDEANRLLEDGAPYRQEAAYLIKEIGRAGRSVGVGVSLSAQAGHVEELGGSDTLRGMLKEGDTVLLRWSSGMMASLVSDGLLPDGVSLVPIPRLDGPPTLRSRFDAAHGTRVRGSSTAGMAYLLGSHRPATLMRFFRVGSLIPADGLDPSILALYGDGDPMRLETASHAVAGGAYGSRGGAVLLNPPRPEAAPAAQPEPGDPTVQLPAAGAEQHLAGAGAQEHGAGPGAPGHLPGPDAPITQGGKAGGSATATSRIKAVIKAAGGSLTKAEIVAALKDDGGRVLSSSRVGAVLSELTGEGTLLSPQRGTYKLP